MDKESSIMKRISAIIMVLSMAFSVSALPYEIIDASSLEEFVGQDPELKILRKNLSDDMKKRTILLTALETPLTAALGMLLALAGNMSEESEEFEESEESNDVVMTGIVTGLISAPLWYLLGNTLSKSMMKVPDGRAYHHDFTSGKLVEAEVIDAYEKSGISIAPIEKYFKKYYHVVNFIEVTVLDDGYLAVYDVKPKNMQQIHPGARFFVAPDAGSSTLIAHVLSDAEYIALMRGDPPSTVLNFAKPVPELARSNTSPFEAAAPSVKRYIDPYAAAKPIDLGGGKTLYAFAASAASATEGMVVGPAGTFASGKLRNGVLDGIGVVGNYLDGRQLAGKFVAGSPEGFAVFTDSKGTAESAEYSKGHRDLSLIPLLPVDLQDLKDLKNSVVMKLSDGVKLEDMDDLLLEIAEKREAVQNKLGPEDLLSSFATGEGISSIRTADGVTWNVKELTENVIRGADGKVVSIERRTIATSGSGPGIGISIKSETITRQTDPVFTVANGGTSFGFNFSTMPETMTLVGLNLGVNYRKFSNGGKAMPGPEGGKGGGLDLRASAAVNATLLNMNTVTYSGWTLVESNETYGFGGLDLAGLIGWTSFRFNPMNEADLTQKGKGWSLGLKANYSLPLSSEDLGDSGGGFGLTPAFSFDRYTYNQATAKYKSSSTMIFAWPYPISISLVYSASF
jgi:hypothetical protein